MSKLSRKLPQPVRTILGELNIVLQFALYIGGVLLVGLLVVVMVEVPWVASGVSLATVLILLIPSNGWTTFGTKVFMGAVGLSALLDVPGNPFYNAPFEHLFLDEGQFLTGEAVVEKPSRGETVVSGNNVVVDANGEMIYDINDFLPFFYRLALYSIIYGTLLTLRGFLPKWTAGKTGKNGTKSTPHTSFERP